MTREQYQAKKAAGLCTVSVGCGARGYRGLSLCYKHWRVQREYHRRWRKVDYDKRKADGRCVETSCRGIADDGSPKCARHRREDAERRHRYLKRPEARAKMAENNREWRRIRNLMGRCFRCSKEVFRVGLCEGHYRAKLAYQESWRRAKGIGPTTHKCGHCRQVGHRYESCTEKLTVDTNEYAGARREWI